VVQVDLGDLVVWGDLGDLGGLGWFGDLSAYCYIINRSLIVACTLRSTPSRYPWANRRC